ncbi:MAG: pantetheine-phosphate adenylyltransferase, partial [Oscillospiraceae bacterium]
MKIAVCPGSFDPITLGHLEIIERTSKIFDKVVVLVMANHRKKGAYAFTAQERAELIRKSLDSMDGLDNVEVDVYHGLLANYAKENNVSAIVKGLRAVSDFENEFQQALTNQKLYADFETLFMSASANYMFLSSSLVRQVGELGGDISEFVPEVILEDI